MEDTLYLWSMTEMNMYQERLNSNKSINVVNDFVSIKDTVVVVVVIIIIAILYYYYNKVISSAIA